MTGVVSGLEGSTVIEIDLDKLQQWTDGNPTQFPKGQGKAHPMGQLAPRAGHAAIKWPGAAALWKCPGG